MASRKKAAEPSLFDWAQVPVVEVPKAPPSVIIPVVEATDADIEAFADVIPIVASPAPLAPTVIHVPVDEPAATAPVPEGVTQIRDSYAFCERNAAGDFWTGRARGEHTHASVLYKRTELVELRRVIDAALALEPEETSK